MGTAAALALTAVALVVAAGAAGRLGPWELGAASSDAPTATPDLAPIPLPNDRYHGTVLDPGTLTTGSVRDAAAAVAVARNLDPALGESAPYVRLMRITTDSFAPADRLDGIYWVLLFDDVFVPISGPAGFSPPENYTSYRWIIMDTDGVIVRDRASSYPEGVAPPTLPPRT